MSKDRAAPFSRKHRRYWLPVTGGMILIGALNLAIGYCSYDPPPPPPQKIELVIPPPTYRPRGVIITATDAGVDAPAPSVPAVAPADPNLTPAARTAPAPAPAGAAATAR